MRRPLSLALGDVRVVTAAAIATGATVAFLMGIPGALGPAPLVHPGGIGSREVIVHAGATGMPPGRAAVTPQADRPVTPTARAAAQPDTSAVTSSRIPAATPRRARQNRHDGFVSEPPTPPVVAQPGGSTEPGGAAGSAPGVLPGRFDVKGAATEANDDAGDAKRHGARSATPRRSHSSSHARGRPAGGGSRGREPTTAQRGSSVPEATGHRSGATQRGPGAKPSGSHTGRGARPGRKHEDAPSAPSSADPGGGRAPVAAEEDHSGAGDRASSGHGAPDRPHGSPGNGKGPPSSRS